MNAREYLDEFGSEQAELVAKAAGTNLAYFEQLACGARSPSFGLAERLVEADNKRKLDVLALMRAKAEREQRDRERQSASPAAA